ncbi:hypothetical protein CDD82_6853 [Ophiocordyceps australis]|uniref:Transcription factor IIIC subunit 5 HTH domain-containing protein n=1 Tax=Ophiocordyceps australis TaxID=1399860 RepID=A0A2C5XYH4_9HYPO|nr:hypothetical protein CDD82_6853 [Ophiocordyceps australis]
MASFNHQAHANTESDVDWPDDQEPVDQAPRYPLPCRPLTAVEIPAVVNNVDRAIKAFGRSPSLSHVLDPSRSSVPLFLNPESPFCPPIMSHNARSHNVVLKITLPKRTGRKRKRGTNDAWQGDMDIGDADAAPNEANICSIARLDQPQVLRQKLADNVDKYKVRAVGVIKRTHRFRGLADFYWDVSKSPFAQQYVQKVLPGDVNSIKTFKYAPGIHHGPNVDILPPPLFTHMSLPFNYNYSQNPYVQHTEDGGTFNKTAVPQVGYFIGAYDAVPLGPQLAPDMTDINTVQVIAQLEEAFEQRPLWTRRSLMNHVGNNGVIRNWNDLKKYLNYTAYQFKGGPWRDSVVPYGVDPRTDPKYRIYQTLMFKMSRKNRFKGQTWQSLRKSQVNSVEDYGQGQEPTHIFDGQTFHTDGKVWQVCDITDPLINELLDSAPVRPTWDINSGWYHGGLWAKVKAIMKTKLVAIQFGRQVTREEFASTLACGDETPTRGSSNTLHLPLPNLNLTNEELVLLRGHEPPKKKSSGYNVRFQGLSLDRPEDDPGTNTPIADSVADEEASVMQLVWNNDDGEVGEDEDEDGEQDEDEGKGDQDEYPGRTCFRIGGYQDDDGGGHTGNQSSHGVSPYQVANEDEDEDTDESDEFGLVT